MRGVVWAGLLWLVAGCLPAVAQEYRAAATGDAALRSAPSGGAAPIGTLPAGTRVTVPICFDEGAYCAVSGDGIDGYVAGDLLAVEGRGGLTVLDAEKARWEDIGKQVDRPRLASLASIDIRTEGDSYMQGAYGVALYKLIDQRLDGSVTNTAVGGSEMQGVADRVLAPDNAALLGRVTIFWDGSHNGWGGLQNYTELLAQAIAALGHDRFIVIPPAAPPATTRSEEQDQIAAEFKRRWPDNYLDWRPIIPNTNGIIDVDQLADPKDKVHLGSAAMAAMADAIAAFVRSKGWDRLEPEPL